MHLLIASYSLESILCSLSNVIPIVVGNYQDILSYYIVTETVLTLFELTNFILKTVLHRYCGYAIF